MTNMVHMVDGHGHGVGVSNPNAAGIDLSTQRGISTPPRFDDVAGGVGIAQVKQ